MKIRIKYSFRQALFTLIPDPHIKALDTPIPWIYNWSIIPNWRGERGIHEIP